MEVLCQVGINCQAHVGMPYVRYVAYEVLKLVRFNVRQATLINAGHAGHHLKVEVGVGS